jgi:hypothetical protein
MSDDPRGPYAPTWKNRRRVTFATLGFCLPTLTAVAFFAPDTAPASTAAWALGGVIIFLLGFYLIGPSWEAAQLTKWTQK